jgi:hypothetical protein
MKKVKKVKKVIYTKKGLRVDTLPRVTKTNCYL